MIRKPQILPLRIVNNFHTAIASVFVALAATAASASAAVQIVDLGTLNGEWSAAYAINDSDQIVGLSDTPRGLSHTFLYSKGRMNDLSPLTGLLSEPLGINNSGQVAGGIMAANGLMYPAIYNRHNGNIMVAGSLGGNNSDGLAGVATAINNVGQAVGFSYLPSGEWHAFIYDKGIMQDLGCLMNETAPCYAYALGINDRGDVVGGTGSDHAFLYTNERMLQLEPDGSEGGRAYSINEQGQVVGYYYQNNVGRGFFYSDGQFTDIAGDGSPYTAAFAINDRGQAVGSTWVADPNVCRQCYSPHAFIYQDGKLILLNSLLPANSGWRLTDAFAINNGGRIVGQGIINNQVHAFLLKMTPNN